MKLQKPSSLEPSEVPKKLRVMEMGSSTKHVPVTDPWDWYIDLHENHKNQPNVGKYTSPMDGMG